MFAANSENRTENETEWSADIVTFFATKEAFYKSVFLYDIMIATW